MDYETLVQSLTEHIQRNQSLSEKLTALRADKKLSVTIADIASNMIDHVRGLDNDSANKLVRHTISHMETYFNTNLLDIQNDVNSYLDPNIDKNSFDAKKAFLADLIDYIKGVSDWENYIKHRINFLLDKNKEKSDIIKKRIDSDDTPQSFLFSQMKDFALVYSNADDIDNAISKIFDNSFNADPDVFLMSESEDEVYEISNITRLNLYKEKDDNRVFYIYDNQKYYLDNPTLFQNTQFDSSKCNNIELVNAVLDFTSRQGHTLKNEKRRPYTDLFNKVDNELTSADKKVKQRSERIKIFKDMSAEINKLIAQYEKPTGWNRVFSWFESEKTKNRNKAAIEHLRLSQRFILDTLDEHRIEHTQLPGIFVNFIHEINAKNLSRRLSDAFLNLQNTFRITSSDKQNLAELDEKLKILKKMDEKNNFDAATEANTAKNAASDYAHDEKYLKDTFNVDLEEYKKTTSKFIKQEKSGEITRTIQNGGTVDPQVHTRLQYAGNFLSTMNEKWTKETKKAIAVNELNKQADDRKLKENNEIETSENKKKFRFDVEEGTEKVKTDEKKVRTVFKSGNSESGFNHKFKFEPTDSITPEDREKIKDKAKENLTKAPNETALKRRF